MRGVSKDGHGPHGSPGDAKHRPETARERLLTMRGLEPTPGMADRRIFALAERPEPRYSGKIAFPAGLP